MDLGVVVVLQSFLELVPLSEQFECALGDV